MSLTIFSSGTKAKSSEINANFQEVLGNGYANVNVFLPDSTTGYGAVAVATMIGAFSMQSSGADLDDLTFKVQLSAGTYIVKLLYQTGATFGILDVDIGGAEVASFDTYSAGTVNNVVGTQASIAVATGGVKDVVVRVDGKNGSSSSYDSRVSGLIIYRTA